MSNSSRFQDFLAFSEFIPVAPPHPPKGEDWNSHLLRPTAYNIQGIFKRSGLGQISSKTFHAKAPPHFLHKSAIDEKMRSFFHAGVANRHLMLSSLTPRSTKFGLNGRELCDILHTNILIFGRHGTFHIRLKRSSPPPSRLPTLVVLSRLTTHLFDFAQLNLQFISLFHLVQSFIVKMPSNEVIHISSDRHIEDQPCMACVKGIITNCSYHVPVMGLIRSATLSSRLLLLWVEETFLSQTLGIHGSSQIFTDTPLPILQYFSMHKTCHQPK